MSEIKSLEHPTIKVSYEILNKKFRATQKVIDRDIDHVTNATKEIEKLLNPQDPPTVTYVRELMSGVVQRLQSLKRKCDETFADEVYISLVCKQKLDHLKAFVPTENSNLELWQASIDQWKRIRLDRIVIEHLLRMGYYETAERLAERSDIRHLTNLDIFNVSREVEDDLSKHQTQKCILWCNDNKSKLRKMNSNIEFNLRAQEVVEFIRKDCRLEAVDHARKHFPPFRSTQLNEICTCMALLAYQPTTEIESYKRLFDENRWLNHVTNFRNENYRLFQLSSQSLLSVTIQAGLSALKTPQCYAPTKNANCPICIGDFNKIAKKLPFSHCVQSRLMCRKTGLPLNEHNHPMMLPNGQIFGELAIPELTLENGSLLCPITNTKFTNPKLEKVFIM